MLDLITCVTSISLGTLGGITHVLIDAKSWDDVKKFSSLRNVLMGSIIGVLYIFLHSDYGFPNFVMTFVSGYAGADFLMGILKRLTKPETKTK